MLRAESSSVEEVTLRARVWLAGHRCTTSARGRHVRTVEFLWLRRTSKRGRTRHHEHSRRPCLVSERPARMAGREAPRRARPRRVGGRALCAEADPPCPQGWTFCVARLIRAADSHRVRSRGSASRSSPRMDPNLLTRRAQSCSCFTGRTTTCCSRRVDHLWFS